MHRRHAALHLPCLLIAKATGLTLQPAIQDFHNQVPLYPFSGHASPSQLHTWDTAPPQECFEFLYLESLLMPFPLPGIPFPSYWLVNFLLILVDLALCHFFREAFLDFLPSHLDRSGNQEAASQWGRTSMLCATQLLPL